MKRVLCLIVALLLLCEMGLCSVTSAEPENPVSAEETVEEQIKVITIPDSLTIKELADKMKLQPSVIIKKLFMQGQIVTVNSEISFVNV